MTTEQKVLAFLKQHDICVMATVGSQGFPEAAAVGFSETEQMELTIGTTKKSRKYQNIQTNANVAVVIGTSDNITVQYEGTIRELEGDELEKRLELHFQKVPSAARFRSGLDQVYLSIKPTWIRYTDYTQDEPIEETRQFA